MTEPVTDQKGMIYFGHNGLNVQAFFGIKPEYFLDIHYRLVKKGLKTPYSEAERYIVFELICNELMKIKFDVSCLIAEFNKAQKDLAEIDHSISLARLCFHYATHGHTIEVVKTRFGISTPDLIINGIQCDLKVRHDSINRIMRRSLDNLEYNEAKLNSFLKRKIKSRMEDLRSALENRAGKGFDQADCIIFDLSNHFHSWNFFRIQAYLEEHKTQEFSITPLEPLKNYCIIFSPDKALNLQVSKFNMRAYWTYILWDQMKREFVTIT